MADAFRESLVRKLGAEVLARIEAVKVGIAGAGGLGSNLASCLVRTGFMRFMIADFDLVEPSDLDRQLYFAGQVGMRKADALRENLLTINPWLEIVAKAEKIEKGMFAEFFKDCPVVAECLDLPDYKAALVSELLQPGRLIVSASGLGGFGSSDDIRVHRVLDNLVVIGDLQSDVAQRPALAPRVILAAAKQADAILEHVVKAGGNNLQ